jgi:hypothetical protein
MHAITIFQPYAGLWAQQIKKYETRPRGISTQARAVVGRRLAIHAGSSRRGIEAVRAMAATKHWAQQTWAFGAVIAVATLTAVQPVEELRLGIAQTEIELGNWGAGRFAWSIGEIRSLRRPVSCGGQQGLWGLDEATLARVWAELERGD